MQQPRIHAHGGSGGRRRNTKDVKEEAATARVICDFDHGRGGGDGVKGKELICGSVLRKKGEGEERQARRCMTALYVGEELRRMRRGVVFGICRYFIQNTGSILEMKNPRHAKFNEQASAMTSINVCVCVSGFVGGLRGSDIK